MITILLNVMFFLVINKLFPFFGKLFFSFLLHVRDLFDFYSCMLKIDILMYDF